MGVGRVRLSEERLRAVVGGLLREVNEEATLDRMLRVWRRFEAVRGSAREVAPDLGEREAMDFRAEATRLVSRALAEDFRDFLQELPQGRASDWMMRKGEGIMEDVTWRSDLERTIRNPSMFGGIDRMREFHGLMADYLPRWERTIRESIPDVEALMARWEPSVGDARERSRMVQAREGFRSEVEDLVWGSLMPVLREDDAGYLAVAAMLGGKSPLWKPPEALRARIERFRELFAPPMAGRRPTAADVKVHVVARAMVRWGEAWPDPSGVEREVRAALEGLPDLVGEIERALAAEDAGRLEKHARAPEGSPLGRIAFSPQRRRRGASLPHEPNTGEEEELRRSLSDFIVDNEVPDSETSDMVRGFLEKGLYDDVFARSRGATLYRGMVLSSEALRGITGMDEEELDRLAGKRRVIERTFNLNPRRGDWSSWSNSFEAARKFAKRNDDGKEGMYCVVLHANADDSLFLDMKKVYDSTDEMAWGFRKEKEHVGIGRIRVHAMEFVRC